jgi:hypothetical protein
MDKEKIPTIEGGKKQYGVDRSKMNECYGLGETPDKSQPPGSTSVSVECQATPKMNEHGIEITDVKEQIRQKIASRINAGEIDLQVDEFISKTHDDIQSEVESLPESIKKSNEYPVVQSQQELVDLYLQAFEEDLSFSPTYVPSDDAIEDKKRRLVDEKVKEVLEAQAKYNKQSAEKIAKAVRKDQLARFQKILKEKKSSGIDTSAIEKNYQRALSDSEYRIGGEFNEYISANSKEKQ